MLVGAKPLIQLSWTTTCRIASGEARSATAVIVSVMIGRLPSRATSGIHGGGAAARGSRRRPASARGASSTSSAGITVSVHTMQNTIPTAVKMPKARTGASGDRANARKPIAVVQPVAITGRLVSSSAPRTAAAIGSSGCAMRR